MHSRHRQCGAVYAGACGLCRKRNGRRRRSVRGVPRCDFRQRDGKSGEQGDENRPAGNAGSNIAGRIGIAWLTAAPVGNAANSLGRLIMWATELHPLTMGILVAVLVGMALTLPISSAAICAGLGLTGLAGGAALAGCCAQMVGFAVMSFRENRWGGLVSQGLGTIGVWTGWTDPGAFDWTGLLLVSFVLPAVICLLIALVFRKMDRIRPGDLSI